MNLNLDRPLASIDLETTGVDTSADRIVELAVVKLHQDGRRETWTRRINPGVPIPEVATAIHGIADTDVEDEPSFADVAAEAAF